MLALCAPSDGPLWSAASPCLPKLFAGSLLVLGCVVAAAAALLRPTRTATTTGRSSGLLPVALVVAAFLVVGAPLTTWPVVYRIEDILCAVGISCVALLSVVLAFASEAQATFALCSLLGGACLVWSASLRLGTAPAPPAVLLFCGAVSTTLGACVWLFQRCSWRVSAPRTLPTTYVLLPSAEEATVHRAESVPSMATAEQRWANVLDSLPLNDEAHDAPKAEADSADAPSDDAKRHARRLIARAFVDEWALLVAGLAVAAVAVASVFAQSVYWGLIVGLVSAPPQQDAFSLLLAHSARLLLLTAAGSVAKQVEVAAIKLAALRISTHVRMAVFAAVVRRPVAFHDAAKPGELMSRLTNDVSTFSDALTTHAVKLVRALLITAGSIAFLFYLSWQLTLGMMASIPLVALVTWIQTRAVARTTALSLNASAGATSVAEEVLSGVRTVFAYRTTQLELERHARWTMGSYFLGRRLVWLNCAANTLVDFCFEAVIVGGIYFAGRRVLEGASTVGWTVTYLLVVMELAVHVVDVPESISGLGEGVGASASLIALLRPNDPPAASAVLSSSPALSAPPHESALELVDVCFVYPSRPTAPVLQHVSLSVPMGTSLAIVGASGAGKTSLVSLLLGFYPATSGAIFIGGRSLDRYTDHELGDLVALVPQEPLLFNTTIAENISYGKSATREEICHAAALAHAAEFIEALPDGYETQCGSRGVQLSGGQRQRICIARAILRDPRVLILDEPTSALSFDSQAVVLATLRALLARRDRAIIVVTHHVNVAAHVDSVALLAHGQIVECGPHSALIQRSQRYREHMGMAAAAQ